MKTILSNNPGYFSTSFPVTKVSLRLSALCEGHWGGTGTPGPVHRVQTGESSSLSSCFQSLRGTDGDLPLVLLCFQGCPALTRARVAAGASRYPAHACSLSPQTETMTARAHANASTRALSASSADPSQLMCGSHTEHSTRMRERGVGGGDGEVTSQRG